MTILINKQTTDSDLSVGMKVCYKDLNGIYSKLGVITDILTDKFGNQNYLINTSFGAYTANELKLISNN